jgi:hypothetical protein
VTGSAAKPEILTSNHMMRMPMEILHVSLAYPSDPITSSRLWPGEPEAAAEAAMDTAEPWDAAAAKAAAL